MEEMAKTHLESDSLSQKWLTIFRAEVVLNWVKALGWRPAEFIVPFTCPKIHGVTTSSGANLRINLCHLQSHFFLQVSVECVFKCLKAYFQ